MFVDACGHEVVSPRPWFAPSLHHRQRVESLFGYSSACVPAILSGRRPDQNDHWCAFYYSPSTSPFRALTKLKALPTSVADRGRVRRYLSKAIATAYGFRGYFQIYNVPFDVLPLFDYAEKRDIFAPGGINRGRSIFDDLADARVPRHVSNWRHKESENVIALEQAIVQGDIRFAFLYTADLDGLMHDATRESALVDEKLEQYGDRIDEILRLASRRYDEVRFALFSDHGMCTVREVVDYMPRVAAAGLRYGVDYAGIYDSTMMRFWFLDGRGRADREHESAKKAELAIRDALPDDARGRWLTDEELGRYGTLWPDGRFGHAIYALEPGVLLNPSHMGKVALKGMHGYRPDHPDSYSALLASFEPKTKIANITDYYTLMREMADWATDRSA